MQFNINDHIKCELTELGLHYLHAAYSTSYIATCFPNLEKTKVVEMQFWEFCNVFGSSFHVGSNPVTVGNVIEIKQSFDTFLKEKGR